MTTKSYFIRYSWSREYRIGDNGDFGSLDSAKDDALESIVNDVDITDLEVIEE